MRPVNLIPAEERRGEQAPLRTGPLPYLLLGALVAALVGVAMMVLTDNQISERQGELATLEQEDAAAAAQAARLASYTQFQSVSEQRATTVQSLADSRFDWERVLRELSLVLPGDVVLSDLTASGAGGGEGSEEAAVSGVTGPSLSMGGCASGYQGVAGFVTALKDIDGVTRVGVQSSQAGEGEAGGSGGGECGGKPNTVQFTLVAAFDAAPVPLGGELEVAPESASEAAQATSSEASEDSGGEAEGG